MDININKLKTHLENECYDYFYNEKNIKINDLQKSIKKSIDKFIKQHNHAKTIRRNTTT